MRLSFSSLEPQNMLARRLKLSPEFTRIAFRFDNTLCSTLADHSSPPISSLALKIRLPIMQAVLQNHPSSSRYPQRPHSTQRNSRRRTRRHETKPAKANKAIKATKHTSKAQQPNRRDTKHSSNSRNSQTSLGRCIDQNILQKLIAKVPRHDEDGLMSNAKHDSRYP